MEYKQQFIQFAIEQNVLRFGHFTLKSGRISPYFFNAGLFNHGATLAKLGLFYAQAIQSSKLEFDILFGPAYKGIPLVTATAMAFSQQFGRDIPYAFNRKEAKSYAEGGRLIGAPLFGSVLIVDDVITAGTAVQQTVEIIGNAGAQAVGVVIALDRQERGYGDKSAIDEIQRELGLQVVSIITLADLIDYLHANTGYEEVLKAIKEYQLKYGVRDSIESHKKKLTNNQFCTNQ